MAQSSRFRRRRTRRGVSDVVATILILAMTVTLFASIFAFVGSFPAPPPQNVSQFQATVLRTSNQSYLSGLTIEHLAGPTITGSDHIYLESSSHVSAWQFSVSGGIPVYWGLPGNSSASVWNLGQTWTTTFTKLIKAPDNITVYITSSTQLLFSVDLPGPVINIPPAILQVGTIPTSPGVGVAFQIWASLGGNLSALTAKVNLAGIPGLSGNISMVLASSGLYVHNVTAGSTTTGGSYYAFLYVANGGGQQTSAAIPVTIVGGGSSSPFTVTVGMSPQPPTLPQQSPSAYFWATISYPGSKSNVPVSVNFTITQVPGGRSTVLTVTNAIPGQTGLTISGPSSLTVYSQAASNFNGWLLNTSVNVLATATLGMGVGTATGSISFSTQNLVTGIIYVTTSSTGSTASTVPKAPATGFSHTCAAACPYLYVTVWDNYTTALGGPATVTFSGVAWANTTSGGPHTYTHAVASTSVTQGASTALDLLGVTTRWTESGAGPGAGTYAVSVWLTIKSSSAGTPIIGYIFDTFPLVVS
jgi:flagellin-like protein